MRAGLEPEMALDRHLILLDVFRGLGDFLWFAQVTPVILVSAKCRNRFAVSSEIEIRVDDREDSLFSHQGK